MKITITEMITLLESSEISALISLLLSEIVESESDAGKDFLIYDILSLTILAKLNILVPRSLSISIETEGLPLILT
jgi:hypothetical protein